MVRTKGSPAPEKGPIKAQVFDIQKTDVRYRHQHESGLWATDPAQVEFTAKGAHLFSQLSLDSGLGTERPPQVLVVSGPGRKNLYFIPFLKREGALDVHYSRDRVGVNLVKIFTELKRLVPPGMREFYPLKLSDVQVDVEGEIFDALVMPLKRTGTRWEKSEEQKAEAKAKADARKAARAAKLTAATAKPTPNP